MFLAEIVVTLFGKGDRNYSSPVFACCVRSLFPPVPNTDDESPAPSVGKRSGRARGAKGVSRPTGTGGKNVPGLRAVVVVAEEGRLQREVFGVCGRRVLLAATIGKLFRCRPLLTLCDVGPKLVPRAILMFSVTVFVLRGWKWGGG